jgi:hypothetical protein
MLSGLHAWWWSQAINLCDNGIYRGGMKDSQEKTKRKAVFLVGI